MGRKISGRGRKPRKTGNCMQMNVNITEQLYDAIAAKAAQYGLPRSVFLRELLEAVDEENAYGRLLGPAPDGIEPMTLVSRYDGTVAKQEKVHERLRTG